MPWKKIEFSRDNWRQIDDEMRGFRRKIRFLIDENIPAKVCAFLRKKKFNLQTLQEADLNGRDDEAIFQYAKQKDRILITRDRHFLNERRFPLQNSPGVAILSCPSDGDDTLIDLLEQLIDVYGDSHDLWYEQIILFPGDNTFSIRCRDSTSSRSRTLKFKFPKNGTPMIWSDE
ncbi:MAG TPA: DUF5615 family PIN-like protein [Thermodesulfobacteriota bacterium]|nr:DUF5615 family PIN-like protein [bacterium]HQO79247.1 DUF5615 family PIN-like protein [Thermodesulfobacteriota bacterium]